MKPAGFFMDMALNTSYNRCIKEMFGLRRFGIKLGLETIRDILEVLGNPQVRFTAIHVAGTNGKGSVASALARILHEAGNRVGLYTSPHLIRFNERICINNQPISDAQVQASYEAVKNISGITRELTFFEYNTAMAFYEFARQKVDWAVIETGMGGRLDATNILSPALSVITNISLEHQMYLGRTLAEIACEKGGIIKKGVPVVTAVKQKPAVYALKKIARSNGSDLYRLGEDFRVRRNQNGSFTYFGVENTWRNMRTSLLGSYQVDNAALVLAACEVLNRDKVTLSFESIQKGLLQNRWPGRLEVVSDTPLVILDGAHNLAAAKNLARFLSTRLSHRKITLVVGILDDKPYVEILQSLLPACDRLILTRAEIDRALPPEVLYPVAKGSIADIRMIPRVADAVRQAVATASPEECVCIAGSLYVVGEAKAALENVEAHPPI